MAELISQSTSESAFFTVENRLLLPPFENAIFDPAQYEAKIQIDPPVAAVPNLRFYPNGLVDIDPRETSDFSQRAGIEYEEVGMDAMTDFIADGEIGIGSHLIDAALTKTRFEKNGVGRPDAIVLRRDRNRYVLTKMFEFKKTWTSDDLATVRKKLKGISSLLSNLRDEPFALGERVQAVTGVTLLNLPILIPADKKLRLWCASPFSFYSDDYKTEGIDITASFITIPDRLSAA